MVLKVLFTEDGDNFLHFDATKGADLSLWGRRQTTLLCPRLPPSCSHDFYVYEPVTILAPAEPLPPSAARFCLHWGRPESSLGGLGSQLTCWWVPAWQLQCGHRSHATFKRPHYWPQVIPIRNIAKVKDVVSRTWALSYQWHFMPTWNDANLIKFGFLFQSKPKQKMPQIWVFWRVSAKRNWTLLSAH